MDSPAALRGTRLIFAGYLGSLGSNPTVAAKQLEEKDAVEYGRHQIFGFHRCSERARLPTDRVWKSKAAAEGEGLGPASSKDSLAS